MARFVALLIILDNERLFRGQGTIDIPTTPEDQTLTPEQIQGLSDEELNRMIEEAQRAQGAQ